ncbi:mucin-17-like isoform X3 [Hylaeus anthracinus]|uniref:mucin-17-like isoform X3 n=1 Tax=Hylaeus anthracinus TaxID=313031 RepID=UPI0023B96833|nr:mucin-17-like isoform X3 [Hylaeus anthracinus]
MIVMKIKENKIVYYKVIAPKLKGRPRRKRKKRSASPGESSNESEASVASTSKSVPPNTTSLVVSNVGRPPSSVVRRSERNTSAEEKKFLTDVQSFMNSRGTPVGKMPLLGYRQIDLFLFYTKVQMLGGYDSVSAGRLWKTIYDDIGGNTGNTSAATITRRHYERLLLPYERYQKGEEAKVRLTLGRRTKTSSVSEESEDVKQETNDLYSSEIPPPVETNLTATTPPLQPIATTPFLSSEKPKTETGKTSSLRSVRVKPERLKSLNTMIANSTPSPSQQANQLPSPPPSSNTSVSTPSSTPSTTPTNGTGSQSVLERQLNSPLISQQVPPSCSPPDLPGLPVTTVATNATTVVTLTPPPEKDMKEIKLDSKQTTLLAQGKENIPLFGEKSIFAEKAIAPPRSPEVIDLESESDTSRDKIIIPSFKKRKLEILREGGLEVTAVDLDTRPSVIQSNPPAPATMRSEEKSPISYPLPVTPNSIPKLISVTVTPDIGHMLSSPQEHQHPHHQARLQVPNKQPPAHHNNNNNNTTVNNNNVVNSRVINLGTSNNAALLQLYANANVPPPASSAMHHQANHRFVPPSVPNGRIFPPKVTQSRSMFAHNEKMVYGDPKDILSPPKYRSSFHRLPHQQHMNNNNDSIAHGGVLDLTQKYGDKPVFPRPSLEIVKVPVVPRPNPLNLEMRNSSTAKEKPTDCSKRGTFPGYQNVLDSRTMASNNLEITIVNPKQKNNHTSTPTTVRVPSPPNRSNAMPAQRRQQVNGRYTTTRSEPVSPYTPRKPISHPVIPNVPNLNHLNSGNSYPRMETAMQQQISIDRRKNVESSGKEQHQQRRISEGDKSLMTQQHQHHQQQQQQHQQESRQTEAGRRHSVPSIPSGYVPTVPQSNPAYLPQLPTNTPGKFLPILDPMYYSAFYNGLFTPPPIPPTATTSFLPPEFSAYYKELLASSQPRLGMAGQNQPTAPTSK